MACICTVPSTVGFSGCRRNKILITQASASEFIRTTGNQSYTTPTNTNIYLLFSSFIV